MMKTKQSMPVTIQMLYGLFGMLTNQIMKTIQRNALIYIMKGLKSYVTLISLVMATVMMKPIRKNVIGMEEIAVAIMW